ncbi:hypothetical protein ABZ865_16635 [Streptomyces sp. NPDC047085]|uniref:hypothetical protein n=1 Tax=Streptomyces sp. NPDC047085 TaxID=3155140 RepID=UPI0033CAB150
MSLGATPTPEEIADALALEEAHARTQPRNQDEARTVVARMYADWRAAHEQGRAFPDLLSFVRDVAENGAVTHPERGETRAFWSWRSQPEGAPREIGHRYLAQACGRSRGMQVLEDSPAGAQLDSYHLFNDEVRGVLTKDYHLDLAQVDETAKAVWKTVSGRYAEAATGPVVAFAADIGKESVLGADELPRLLAHEKVGKEHIEFPVDMPRHEQLPPEIDSLIGDKTLRSQWRMEDIDPAKTSPKEFAHKLAAMDVPERLKESHEAALWRLGSADSYEELNARQQRQRGPAVNEFLPGVKIRPVAMPAAPRGPTAGHGALNPAAALTLPPPAPERQPAGVEL